MTAPFPIPDQAALDRLDGAQALLYERMRTYHRLGEDGFGSGATTWAHCARSAAWAGLVARSWRQVAELVPPGLLSVAAVTSTLHFDTERGRWRSVARDIVTERRCPKRPGDRRCRFTQGHHGDCAPLDA